MTDPITTPAEMREAAAQLVDEAAAMWRRDCVTNPLAVPQYYQGMSDGAERIAAAIRALPVAEPAPVAVKVKPLEWVDFEDRGAKAQAWGEANYLIQRWSDGRYELSASYPGYGTGVPETDRFFSSLAAAKDAANADNEARVLSQIDAVPAARVRAELAALREAADALAFANARLLQRVRETSADKWMPHAADAADAALATYRTTKEAKE